jgi:hypothetical protein
MGIGDRDYMRRRRGGDDDRPADDSVGSKLVEWLSRFFEKYPRFGVWVAAILGVAILVVLILARLSSN